MFRGVCADPGWGPGGVGSPDPAMLASLGIRRLRIISRPGLAWYVDACWQQNIYVRAVVVDGFYCMADEFFVLNEPNLQGKSAWQFAQELQIHRNQYPDLTLIAGALGDDLSHGIDAAAYMTAVRRAGGLVGYQGVAMNYPVSAARIGAVKYAAGGLPVHVPEYYRPQRELAAYLSSVIYPAAATADWFCINDGMRDPGWTQDMGLFYDDWSAKPLLRQWLSLLT